MLNSEKMYLDIDALPPEAQGLLIDFIELLKKRYGVTETGKENDEKSLYDKFDEIGFIGGCSLEEDLSTTYKQVMRDTLKRGDVASRQLSSIE